MTEIAVLTVERVSVMENDVPVQKRQIRAVFRFAVANPAFRVPVPGLSAGLFPGSSRADIEKLRSGEEVEKPGTALVPVTATLAEARQALNAAWAAANTEFQAELPGRFYGIRCVDGVWQNRS